MIKINEILELVNSGFKTHYFKDITTYEVCNIITKEDSEGNEIKQPAIYQGRGNYSTILEDSKGLVIYHRIESFENDEDVEGGFGRDSMTTETYTIKTVFWGQQAAIEDDNCEDINLYLAKEFKKLVPRRLDLVDTNRITVTGINYDKEGLKEDEGLKYSPESVLFSLSLNIIIKGIERCNDLTCPKGIFDNTFDNTFN